MTKRFLVLLSATVCASLVVASTLAATQAANITGSTGTLNAQALATGARLARTLMDWLTWRWVTTPGDFTQGSSIMPQKRNPVVLEHLVSMAGATAADAASVLNNVGAAWWEDSNNATTDVQVRLWESNDRTAVEGANEADFKTVVDYLVSKGAPRPAPIDPASRGRRRR